MNASVLHTYECLAGQGPIRYSEGSQVHYRCLHSWRSLDIHYNFQVCCANLGILQLALPTLIATSSRPPSAVRGNLNYMCWAFSLFFIASTAVIPFSMLPSRRDWIRPKWTYTLFKASFAAALLSIIAGTAILVVSTLYIGDRLDSTTTTTNVRPIAQCTLALSVSHPFGY